MTETKGMVDLALWDDVERNLCVGSFWLMKDEDCAEVESWNHRAIHMAVSRES